MWIAITLLIVLIGLFYISRKERFGTRPMVILYYRHDCPACIRFVDTWNKLRKRFGEQIRFQATEITPDDVTYYPTIVMINDELKKIRYDGNYTYDNVVAWIYNVYALE